MADITRRVALSQSALALGGLAAAAWSPSLLASSLGASSPSPRARPRARPGRLGKLRIYQIGVGGTIAPHDREQLTQHPDVEIAGLCDVDSDALAKVSAEFPSAFTCKDFRDGFTKHADSFDAVIVCTPDHNHCVPMQWSLRAGKHTYGQKPLVQQLSEVKSMQSAIASNPSLVTQVGNQRMGPEGRQHAVNIVRDGLLGPAREAYVWVDGPPDDGSFYFYYGGLKEPSPPPANLDWELWLGCAQDAPFREGLGPIRWRSSWDYGTGQLGDWCTHLLDVPYYALELPSPIAVQAQTHWPSDFYHAQHVASTLTYPVTGPRFANNRFVMHYCDKGQYPSRAALGLPAGTFGGHGTLIACEGGVMQVNPEGDVNVWIDGKEVDWRKLPGLRAVQARNHWHSWIDKILGREAFVQTPFSVGVQLAEAGLLCAKAARYPGQELRWDLPSLTFTNNEEATKSIVRRDYRSGFEPPYPA